jgi:hypothetical protein
MEQSRVIKYVDMSCQLYVFQYNLCIERHEKNCVSITGYYLDSICNCIIYLLKVFDIFCQH